MLSIHIVRAARLALLAAAGAGALAAAVARGDAALAPAAVDLQRYFGRWYVVARTATGGPRTVGAYFEFAPSGDGSIRDVFYARAGSFDDPLEAVERSARPEPDRPGHWRVRSGWLSSEERVVVYVSADYRHALAVDPEERTSWVLAREPLIAEWTYAGLVARLAMHGYDVSRLRKVPQEPEQIGRPGFE